ncbi:MAG: hypothetical protein WC222_06445 [Parachlamydiales bacterium]|jgi:hypothetical protein
MNLTLLYFGIQQAKNTYNSNDFFNKSVYPRIVLIALGPLTSVGEVFKQIGEFCIKLPITGTYVLIGWLPRKRTDEGWLFVGSLFDPVCTFSGQAATLKSAAFAFGSIFVTLLYGFYDPKGCIDYYLADPLLEEGEEESELPPLEDTITSRDGNEELESQAPEAEKAIFRRVQFTINANIPSSPSRKNIEQRTNKYSPLRILRSSPSKNCLRGVRTLMDYKPHIGQEIILNRDSLSLSQKSAVDQLMGRINKANPETRLKLLQKEFNYVTSESTLPREIIAKLFWEAVSLSENMDTYTVGEDPIAESFTPPASPIRGGAEQSNSQYVPINQKQTVVALSRSSLKMMVSFADRLRQVDEGESYWDEAEEESEIGFEAEGEPEVTTELAFEEEFPLVNVAERRLRLQELLVVKTENDAVGKVKNKQSE